MKLRDWGAFFLLSLLWGSSFLWIKIAVQEIGPFTLVAFRLLFAGLSMLVVVAVRRPALPPNRRQWLYLALVGLMNTAIPFVLISWGQQFIDSGVASVLNGTVPLFAMLIGHFVLADERVSWAASIGLLGGFSGVVLLVGGNGGGAESGNRLLGQLAVLAASVAYGASSVFVRKYLRGVAPTLQAFMTVAVADAAVWIAAFLVESPFQPPVLPLTWFALVWLGLLGSSLAYMLYYHLIQTIGATRTTMVTYVLPVVGVALGVVFLQELLSLQIVAGTGLILAGVYMVNR